MKDIIKLLIGLWIAKKFLLDNDMVERLSTKVKDAVKDFLK